jgi:hypothetical protein
MSVAGARSDTPLLIAAQLGGLRTPPLHDAYAPSSNVTGVSTREMLSQDDR